MSIRALPSRLVDISLYLAAVAVGLMMVHVSADVVAKLVFGWPLLGTLETVSLYYMVAVVFLPLGAVQRERGHIFVELFTHGLGLRAQRALDALALMLAFALTAVLFWTGTEVALEKSHVGELSNNIELQFQVWPGRWFPVIGFALAAGCCAVQLVIDIAFVVLGRDFAEPHDRTDTPQTGD